MPHSIRNAVFCKPIWRKGYIYMTDEKKRNEITISVKDQEDKRRED